MTDQFTEIATLRLTGYCEAMAEAEGGIAEEKQCWQRRLARKNWCATCDERTTALDALGTLLRAKDEELERLREVVEAAIEVAEWFDYDAVGAAGRAELRKVRDRLVETLSVYGVDMEHGERA